MEGPEPVGPEEVGAWWLGWGSPLVLAGNVLSCFRSPFPPGDRVTFNGKECMCQKCSLPKSAGGSVHLSQGLWSK